MEKEKLEKLKTTPIMIAPRQMVATYWEDNKISSVCVDIKENEQIGVCFKKDYVVVRTQTEVKFVCKGKAFISLWR